MDLNNKKEKISRLIVDYLQKYPEAGETFEGIMKWWLELERIELSVNEVADVLESLIQKGVIKMYKTAGGTIFYKINKEA